MFNRRQWAAAETAYSEFRRDHGVDERALEALFRIGITRARRNNTAGAIAAWRDVLRSPSNRPAERDALRRALAALFEALEPDRGRHERDQILNRLAQTFPDDKPTTIRLHAAEGRRQFERADFSATIRLLGAVETFLDDLDRQYLRLARAHSGRGGHDPGLVLKLANDRLKANDIVVAARLYELALASRPSMEQQREARTRLGWALYLQDEHGKAERLWRDVIAKSPRGDEWRGRSRWHLIVLSAGVASDHRQARNLCEEQFQEFRDSFFGRQAKLTTAWLYMVDKQWREAKHHFQELVDVYDEQNNPRIAEYILRCERELKQ